MNRYGWIVLVLVVIAGLGPEGRAATFRVVDDLTVDGSGGSETNPDLEVKGYSAFSTTPTNASTVTSGAGSVYIEGSLEVDGSAYLATGIWNSSGNVGIGTTSPGAKLVVNGGLAIPNSGSVVTVTTDDFVVSVGDRSYISLTSDSGTGTSRDWCLSAGVTGQLLVLEWTGGDTADGVVTDGGTCNGAAGAIAAKLSANWPASQTTQQDDTLTLIYNGTNWVEMSRAAN